MQIIKDLVTQNSFVMSFLFIGLVMAGCELLANRLFRGRVHASAIAIFAGLVAAYIGGRLTGGSKGIADVAAFSGVGLLGGSMMRDFTIIATSYGADLNEFKKCGKSGVIALFFGVLSSFVVGMIIAIAFGFRSPDEVTVIASGAVSFIVGPVTASTLGVTSEVVAVSIAAGVVKSIAIMIGTPIVGKYIGLTTPKAAMVYGAMMGSTSGVSAGLAATDETLVPYGAMMATFYLGLGCLVCPTLFHWMCSWLVGLLV